MTDTAAITAEQVAAAGIQLAPGQNPDGSFKAAPPENQQAPAAERPAGLPEKFKTVDDLIKAYAELEKKQGAQPAPKADDGVTPQVAQKEQSQEPAEEAIKAQEKAAQDAGVDMAHYEAKFREQGGKFTEADYAELKAKGLSQETVDAYIEGRKAVATARAQEILNHIGGEEAFNALNAWATSEESGVTDAEIEAVNKALQAGGAQAKLALDALKARMTAAEGSNPKLLGGKQPTTAAGDVFNSLQEQVVAQSDPRYATDPAYQAQVIAKIERSIAAGKY
ncbi:capsid assembly protein [Inquilinus limosus]|uniref:capsid assembly protein n=1 Tax=Inquilinus limosus TaxID=171674 RepID=UPI00047D7485|nr:hypothetical protein [Inquilinus limosus]